MKQLTFNNQEVKLLIESLNVALDRSHLDFNDLTKLQNKIKNTSHIKYSHKSTKFLSLEELKKLTPHDYRFNQKTC